MFGDISALSAIVAAPKIVTAQDSDQLIDPNGSYDTVPLKRDTITYALIQSPAWPLDLDDTGTGKRENVHYGDRLCDKMVNDRGVTDIVSFNEYPIDALHKWTREEMLKVAIDIQETETEVIDNKCKEYGMWDAFGC